MKGNPEGSETTDAWDIKTTALVVKKHFNVSKKSIEQLQSSEVKNVDKYVHIQLLCGRIG